ncbi:hypothetical protein M426DRAFT_145443 [Hypoxylon sp. CI-4A]|nr:hypothetical protein M426DRAFT_145443 [Hypoxylon sp. CI-4A]
MQLKDIQSFFARSIRREERSQQSLPAYSVLAANARDSLGIPLNVGSTDDDDIGFDIYGIGRCQNVASCRLSQFLSHFTLGFADGLTVPFALTAGLSSLGETKTVIYAGMAEICAGCISMGVGGYLAARGEAVISTNDHVQHEKPEETEDDDVQKYLSVLDLPPDLLRSVQDHIDNHPVILGRLLSDVSLSTDGSISKNTGLSPATVGLSVALGYLIGGLLPLFPYFFVNGVGDGLKWSFFVCLLSLFIFGFTKDYLLHLESAEGDWQEGDSGKMEARWERTKQSWWEGMRMVIMGGMAAIAAVVCVRLFEGLMP